MSQHIYPYRDIMPKIGKNVFIAPTAAIVGDVHIGDESSVWYGCTVRGDVNIVRIGKRTNIQDGTVIHEDRKQYGCIIGDDITVGHSCLLHACTLEDGCFIGMQACILDGAVVESGAMVAAGALVTGGKRIPAGELWAGRPAKFMRKLTEEELQEFQANAAHYVALAAEYL